MITPDIIKAAATARLHDSLERAFEHGGQLGILPAFSATIDEEQSDATSTIKLEGIGTMTIETVTRVVIRP